MRAENNANNIEHPDTWHAKKRKAMSEICASPRHNGLMGIGTTKH